MWLAGAREWGYGGGVGDQPGCLENSVFSEQPFEIEQE